jgi:hypothetical protein
VVKPFRQRRLALHGDGVARFGGACLTRPTKAQQDQAGDGEAAGFGWWYHAGGSNSIVRDE